MTVHEFERLIGDRTPEQQLSTDDVFVLFAPDTARLVSMSQEDANTLVTWKTMISVECALINAEFNTALNAAKTEAEIKKVGKVYLNKLYKFRTRLMTKTGADEIFGVEP